MSQQTRVYLRGTVLDTDYVNGTRVERDRKSNIANRKALLYLTKDGYDDVLPTINDAVIIKRGPTTGEEYVHFRGFVNIISEQNDGRVLLEIRDPLYFYQYDVIEGESYDSDIDSEAGVVSAIASTIITDGGQTPQVIASTDYPIRKRIVFNMVNRFEALKRLASYINYDVYYDHSLDTIKFEPQGYTDYATNLITGTSGNIYNNPIWNVDKTRMRNYVIVNGAFEYEWKTETFSPDGVTTTFTLDYEPGMSELDIDGTKKTRGVVSSTDTYDYYVKEEQKQIIFIAAPAGTTMTVNYQAKIPKSIRGGNDESISRYGQQSQAFDFKDIVDVADAENRHSYLLSQLEWPTTSTTLHIKDINDIDIGHRVRVIDLRNNRDVWLNVFRVVYTWPEQYDILEVGESDDSVADVITYLNNRLVIMENLERQNSELLTQFISGTHILELDNTAIMQRSAAPANYYDDGIDYDDSNSYDVGGESFSDLEVFHNDLEWSEDLKASTWVDTGSTTATIDNTNGTITFTVGQIFITEILFEGFTPTNCRLKIPASAITGAANLTYEVSADNGSNYEAVTLNNIYTFVNADSNGVILKITASGNATIDLRTNALKIPDPMSLEVDII